MFIMFLPLYHVVSLVECGTLFIGSSIVPPSSLEFTLTSKLSTKSGPKWERKSKYCSYISTTTCAEGIKRNRLNGIILLSTTNTWELMVHNLVFIIMTCADQKGGEGVMATPWKSQIIWVSIEISKLITPWKKLDPLESWIPPDNVGPPLDPWKSIDFPKVNHWPLL